MSPSVIGWDIGGVNTKVARVHHGAVVDARTHPYELQRAPGRLADVLRDLGRAAGVEPDDAHAITMTAELSQFFRTKREGVDFILDAVERAWGSAVAVFAVDGRFLAPGDARREPLSVAASNWAATARIAALRWPEAILVDIGTTTTDIIPIVGGVPVAVGRTDPERLREGELLYLGALRTPVEAIVQEVPLDGGWAGVSAEGFALAGDVHLWRGDLLPEHYTVPTPDGRPATREFARERLARVICADREMLDDDAIDALARHVADSQQERIARALDRVRRRQARTGVVVAAGLGHLLALRAARRLGLDAVSLGDMLGIDAARAAPAAAVALLHERGRTHPTTAGPRRATSA